MVTSSLYACPKCRSHDVRGGKYCVDSSGDRDINLYDFFCHRCHTLEERRSDALDFDTWKRRWYARDHQ